MSIAEQWAKIDALYSEIEVLCHNEGRDQDGIAYDKIPLVAIFAVPNPDSQGKHLITVMTVKEDCSDAFYLLGMMIYVDKGQIKSKAFDDAFYQYRASIANQRNYIRLKSDEKQYMEQLAKVRSKIAELEKYTLDIFWKSPFFIAIEAHNDDDDDDQDRDETEVIYVTTKNPFVGYPAFNIVKYACMKPSLYAAYEQICLDNPLSQEVVAEEIAYLESLQ